MKTIIKKVIPIKDNPYFAVYAEGNTSMIGCFTFKEDAPEGDVYNVNTNYERALKLAKRIETAGTITDIEEIVYQTQNNEQH